MTTLREELERLADNSPTFRDPQDREEALYAQKLDRRLALAAANLALEAAAKLADADEDAYASKIGRWPEAAAYNQGREHEAASLCAAIRAMRVERG